MTEFPGMKELAAVRPRRRRPSRFEQLHPRESMDYDAADLIFTPALNVDATSYPLIAC
jgi:hypothetical protein